MAWKGAEKTVIFQRIFSINSVWISVLLSLLVLTSYVLSRPEIGLLPSIEILELIEAKTLDFRFWLRGQRHPGNDIVIIAVDEKTEDDLGRWQSSGRRWIAEMLEILQEGGTKVIGFDVTFAEPDEGAALKAVDDIKTHLAQEIDDGPPAETMSAFFTYLDEVKTTHDYDRRLAQALQESENVVLGIYHFFNKADATHLTPQKQRVIQQYLKRVKYTTLKFAPGTTPQPLRLRHSFGVEINLPVFSEAAKSFGHFTLVKDPDGYVRKAPLLVEYMGDYYPSLALEVVRAYLECPISPIISALGGEGGGSIDEIQIGNLTIPTDEQGQLLINFYGPERTFPHYSLSDVVLRKISPGTFENKIVLFGFIGSIYQDVHSTPFQPGTYPGVEVHASIIENIIREDFLLRPEATVLVDAIILLVLGSSLGIGIHRAHTLRWDVYWIALSVTGVIAIAYAAFSWYGVWLNMTFPLVFIALNYVVTTSYKYFTEEKKRKAIKHAFEHYVSPAVVKKIMETAEHPALAQQSQVLSVLFSDIRDFVKIAEEMGTGELTEFLDGFFTPMTEIVLKYGGTVDKYIGDAIMVFYGAPETQPDHAVRACKTAVEMLIRVQELGVRWAAEGLPRVTVGMGINSGEMSVGNIGAKDRFDYTVMGDNVNLASRLEGINKVYGTNIVISHATYTMLNHAHFLVRELDTVRIRGRKEAVSVYELVGYGGYFHQKEQLIEKFRKGVAAYKRRQWEEAIVLFRSLAHSYPEDIPTRVYLKRCESYQWAPPPDEWDGVFEIKTK